MCTDSLPEPVEGHPEVMPRAVEWAKTMHGHGDDLVTAHADTHASFAEPGTTIGRIRREERERLLLRPGATLSSGAGNRATEEEPDPERTCFERDR
ncbi:MAG TPA: deoxyguanosinetriphosphate triphosphohydrolase, partial [Candidatus Luteococcus avicola]|nr:deoxyguanosinetriphosphate triphosphohydrolase [Candidatus Luteococcus avicola]